MVDGSDPRVFLSAERTLLAWLRTGVSIVGLGFVVSRFGLFLRAVGHQPAGPTPTIASAEVGVALVVLGGMAIGGATCQHVCLVRRLAPADLPRGYWTWFATYVSVALTVATGILATYLLRA